MSAAKVSGNVMMKEEEVFFSVDGESETERQVERLQLDLQVI